MQGTSGYTDEFAAKLNIADVLFLYFVNHLY